MLLSGACCTAMNIYKVCSETETHDVLCLQPGAYSYQYLVDGTWMTSPDAPVGPDDEGHLCNKVFVRLPASLGCLATTVVRSGTQSLA